MGTVMMAVRDLAFYEVTFFRYFLVVALLVAIKIVVGRRRS